MSLVVMLVPIEDAISLTSVSLGIMHAMKRKNLFLRFFKPIAQTYDDEDIPDQTIAIFRKNHKFSMSITEPLKMSYVESLLSYNQKDALMVEIIKNYYANDFKSKEIVLMEGLSPTCKYQFIHSLNYEIAKMLNAKVIFIMSRNSDIPGQMKQSIQLAYNNFGGEKNSNIVGIIFNKLHTPKNGKDVFYSNLYKEHNENAKSKMVKIDLAKIIKDSPLPVLGVVPLNLDLMTIRAIDIARYLNACIINTGDINTRRIKSITFCVHKIPNMLENLDSGSLLVISTDYPEALTTACLAVMNGIEIGAILLTDGYNIDVFTKRLCSRAFSTGLPVFAVNINIWQIAMHLKKSNLEIPSDDYEHIKRVQEYVSNCLDVEQIESLISISGCSRRLCLSPPVFLYQLTELARKANKRILLPEGNEPRIIKAAAICAKRRTATCILLGQSDDINRIATFHGIKLEDDIEIIDPKTVREKYINRLVDLRKSKGMNETAALEHLKNDIVLGTLMLEMGDVDGLVSGATHTTADTIRPSLQLIKTVSGSSLVSSIFFMLFPEQVYVYGDCAINPDPTSEQLAEIAIQSADSALAFGIEPFVAMLSYSTGISGSGSAVEKVREATRLAHKKRPDLNIDGPLQYDTAVMSDVAKSKAPNSLIAGHATVFIFPDLNSGNITYKAVQRSANLISIGPMLQGMRKPVNDLSRGALVEDIVYTITLTAIQAIKS